VDKHSVVLDLFWCGRETVFPCKCSGTEMGFVKSQKWTEKGVETVYGTGKNGPCVGSLCLSEGMNPGASTGALVSDQ
jgi:hypothetical protein